jgi:hypothetical protein
MAQEVFERPERRWLVTFGVRFNINGTIIKYYSPPISRHALSSFLILQLATRDRYNLCLCITY